jgi:hypothetical protein
MLGRTLPGLRVKDLRTVLRYLRARPDLDGSRVALWGDSFAPANPAEARLEVPWDAPKLPEFAHPAGAMAALFGMLFDEGVKAAYARGGLESFSSVLRSPFLYVPHDALVPGALTVGDLPDVAAALSSRGWRHDGAVDGLNRRTGPEASDASPARWLLSRIAP